MKHLLDDDDSCFGSDPVQSVTQDNPDIHFLCLLTYFMFFVIDIQGSFVPLSFSLAFTVKERGSAPKASIEEA